MNSTSFNHTLMEIFLMRDMSMSAWNFCRFFFSKEYTYCPNSCYISIIARPIEIKLRIYEFENGKKNLWEPTFTWKSTLESIFYETKTGIQNLKLLYTHKNSIFKSICDKVLLNIYSIEMTPRWGRTPFVIILYCFSVIQYEMQRKPQA